jgi:DNA-binding CsgD family transcriptional regulator
MSRPANRWADPAPGGTMPTEPIQVIDLYPNPLPPQPPLLTRDIQAAFGGMTDAELILARLWLLGKSSREARDQLRMSRDTSDKLIRRIRRKLRDALVTAAPQVGHTPATPNPQPNTGTPQETEGSSPV